MQEWSGPYMHGGRCITSMMLLNFCVTFANLRLLQLSTFQCSSTRDNLNKLCGDSRLARPAGQIMQFISICQSQQGSSSISTCLFLFAGIEHQFCSNQHSNSCHASDHTLCATKHNRCTRLSDKCGNTHACVDSLVSVINK